MEEFVCRHLELSREDIIKAIKEKNLKTVEEIMDETDAGSVCASCIPEITEILYDILDGEI